MEFAKKNEIVTQAKTVEHVDLPVFYPLCRDLRGATITLTYVIRERELFIMSISAIIFCECRKKTVFLKLKKCNDNTNHINKLIAIQTILGKICPPNIQSNWNFTINGDVKLLKCLNGLLHAENLTTLNELIKYCHFFFLELVKNDFSLAVTQNLQRTITDNSVSFPFMNVTLHGKESIYHQTFIKNNSKKIFAIKINGPVILRWFFREKIDVEQITILRLKNCSSLTSYELNQFLANAKNLNKFALCNAANVNWLVFLKFIPKISIISCKIMMSITTIEGCRRIRIIRCQQIQNLSLRVNGNGSSHMNKIIADKDLFYFNIKKNKQ
ncbi:MAG: hypothetical protein LBI69_04500 [Puniceicoccales bacterium]|nr:hypothetical protein [Puniceicoccales bacterium]